MGKCGYLMHASVFKGCASVIRASFSWAGLFLRREQRSIVMASLILEGHGRDQGHSLLLGAAFRIGTP